MPQNPELAKEDWQLFAAITDRYPQHPAGGAIAIGFKTLQDIAQRRTTLAERASLRLGENERMVIARARGSHKRQDMPESSNQALAESMEFAGALPMCAFYLALATLADKSMPLDNLTMPLRGSRVLRSAEKSISTPTRFRRAMRAFTGLNRMLGTKEDEDMGILTPLAEIAGAKGVLGVEIKTAQTPQEKFEIRVQASKDLQIVIKHYLTKDSWFGSNQIVRFAKALTQFEPDQSLIRLIR